MARWRLKSRSKTSNWPNCGNKWPNSKRPLSASPVPEALFILLNPPNAQLDAEKHAMYLQGQLTAHLRRISRSSDELRDQLKTAWKDTGRILYPARGGAFEAAKKLTDEIRMLEDALELSNLTPMYSPIPNKSQLNYFALKKFKPTFINSFQGGVSFICDFRFR